MPKSRLRKGHKTKVVNHKNKQRQNINAYKKWLSAITDINAGAVVEPGFRFPEAGGSLGNTHDTQLTPTPNTFLNLYE